MTHFIIYIGASGVGLFLLWAAWCLISVVRDPQQGGREARRAKETREKIDSLFSEAHQRVVSEAMRHRRGW